MRFIMVLNGFLIYINFIVKQLRSKNYAFVALRRSAQALSATRSTGMAPARCAGRGQGRIATP
jgi:hypothetical protein